MRISIYLGPGKGNVVNAASVDKGNPGIGGTQYCMLELAHYLNVNTDFQVSLIAKRNYLVEEGIDFLLLKDEAVLCDIVQSINSDILIMSQFCDKSLEKEIANVNCKVIIWSHNYIYADFCNVKAIYVYGQTKDVGNKIILYSVDKILI